MRSLISFFLIGIAATGWFFIFQPEFTSVRLLRQDITGVEGLRNEIEGFITKRDELYREYQNIPPAEVSRLLAVAPDDPDIRNMVVTLEAIANRSGVALKQIEFAPPGSGAIGVTSGAFVAVPVTFTIDATYDGFVSFLKGVERNARLIDVTDFSFGELTLAQRMGFSIRGNMYYRR